MALLLEQVKNLYDAGLLSNVQITGPLLLSLAQFKQPDPQSMAAQCQLCVYYGDSLYENQEYKRAEIHYQKAMQLRKSVVKNKVKPVSTPLASEVDIRYKIYLCQMEQKEFKDALKTLDDIPQKQRTPKITMCLAKLYHRMGVERPAIACYKDVLRSCPLALEAAMGLLDLGQSATEVISLMTACLPSVNNIEWLLAWLKAHCLRTTSKFTKAAQSFKALESQHLRDNVELLCSMAECHWHSGDSKNAKALYQRIRKLDDRCLRGMDIYARILSQDGEQQEVEKLAQELIQISQHRPEPWIAMAHWSSITNKKTRAIYFSQKAHNIDNRNIEALLTKGALLSSLKRKREAVDHYREALRLSPVNYDANKGLIECYITSNRNKEALAIAKNVHKAIGTNARSLTLLAMVLSRESQTLEKAKQMLEKAVSQDPTFADAIHDLAEILTKEQDHEGAVTFIRKHLAHINTANLHIILGDNLAALNEYQEALDQYSIGISMCPGNARAIAGISHVESLTGGTELDSPDDISALDDRNMMVAETSEENTDDEEWDLMNQPGLRWY